MSLTTEERVLVIRWLRKYPAGISACSWGKGVMDDGNVLEPEYYDESTLLECG
jgi:hypothetical protein